MDGLPINSMVIFHGELLNNQMVLCSYRGQFFIWPRGIVSDIIIVGIMLDVDQSFWLKPLTDRTPLVHRSTSPCGSQTWQWEFIWVWVKTSIFGFWGNKHSLTSYFKVPCWDTRVLTCFAIDFNASTGGSNGSFDVACQGGSVNTYTYTIHMHLWSYV